MSKGRGWPVSLPTRITFPGSFGISSTHRSICQFFPRQVVGPAKLNPDGLTFEVGDSDYQPTGRVIGGIGGNGDCAFAARSGFGGLILDDGHVRLLLLRGEGGASREVR